MTKAGGSVQFGQIDLQAGSTFAIDAADNLTGNVVVAGAGSELDFNKALLLYGAIVSIYGGGTLNANDDLAVTDGLIEVNSGGMLNAGGDLSAASVSLHQGVIELSSQTLTCSGLALDGSSSAVNRSGGSVQVRNLNLYNGADFAIDADDNLINSIYVNGVGTTLDLNKSLSLTGDITVGGAGVVNANDDLSANTTGVYLGGQLNLHGNSYTVNSLTLENSGTIDKDGGDVQIGSIRLYNGASFAIDADDSLTGSVTVEDAGSSLAINKDVTLAGPVFVFNNGEITTTGTADIGGTWGLQIYAGTFDAGGDVDVSAAANAVGVAQGGMLKLNGHGFTAHQLSLGYSPYFGGDTPAAIERGTGGTVHLDSIAVRKGSTFSIETGDTLTDAVAVDGAGSELAINRDLTLADRATVADGGLLSTAGTLEFSGFIGLQVFNGTADLGGDVSATAGAVGVANGGTIELNGHTITTSQLHIGSTTVFVGSSPGTLNRGVGGSVHVGSLFLYNGSTFSIDAADDLNDYASVDGAGSQLDLNRALSLTGSVSVDNGGTLHAHDDLALSDAVVKDGTMTTDSTLNLGGFYGLQLQNSTFNAGDDVDASLAILGVGISDGGTLELNGHTLTADVLRLGYSDYFGGSSAGTLNRGTGGSVQLDDITLENGSTFSIEAADSLSGNVTVAGAGSVLTLGRSLSLVGPVDLNTGGTLVVDEQALTLDGSLAIDAMSELALEFGPMSVFDDWIFRWAGNHAAEITALHEAGQITWNLDGETDVTVREYSDGYTYVVFFPRAAGDYNDDGIVDAADYTVWRNNLGTADPAADGDRSGMVDEQDFIIWKRTYGEEIMMGGGGGSMAVPEPAGLALALLLAAVASVARPIRRSL